MNVVRRWTSVLTGLFGLARLGWGGRLVHMAFSRDTPPRSGGSPCGGGLPDEIMYRIGSILLFCVGFAAVQVGLLGLGASVAWFARRKRGSMRFACAVNGSVWCGIAALCVVLVEMFGADRAEGYLGGTGALGVSALCFWAFRLYRRET